MSETPSFPSGAEFEAIASVIQTSTRGRDFLTEFARRSRAAERADLRDAVTQLELAIAREVARAPDGASGVLAKVPPATSDELRARLEQAVAELDGIVATTTSSVAAMLKGAKEARALAMRAEAKDEGLAHDLAELAGAIEVSGYQAHVGNRTREIFDVLSEVRDNLDRAPASRTVIAASVSVSTAVPRIAAANDAGPTGAMARLRTLSDEERIALFT